MHINHWNWKYKVQCKSPQLQNGHSKYTELTEMYRHWVWLISLYSVCFFLFESFLPLNYKLENKNLYRSVCFLQEKLLSNVCVKAWSASECVCHIGKSQYKGGKSHFPLWRSNCPFRQPPLKCAACDSAFQWSFECSKDAVLQSWH